MNNYDKINATLYNIMYFSYQLVYNIIYLIYLLVTLISSLIPVIEMKEETKKRN